MLPSPTPPYRFAISPDYTRENHQHSRSFARAELLPIEQPPERNGD
jgi:hypothetical protein